MLFVLKLGNELDRPVGVGRRRAFDHSAVHDAVAHAGSAEGAQRCRRWKGLHGFLQRPETRRKVTGIAVDHRSPVPELPVHPLAGAEVVPGGATLREGNESEYVIGRRRALDPLQPGKLEVERRQGRDRPHGRPHLDDRQQGDGGDERAPPWSGQTLARLLMEQMQRPGGQPDDRQLGEEREAEEAADL